MLEAPEAGDFDVYAGEAEEEDYWVLYILTGGTELGHRTSIHVDYEKL